MYKQISNNLHYFTSLSDLLLVVCVLGVQDSGEALPPLPPFFIPPVVEEEADVGGDHEEHNENCEAGHGRDCSVVNCSTLTALLAVKEVSCGAGSPGVLPTDTPAVLQVPLLSLTAVWASPAGAGAGVVVVQLELSPAVLSPHLAATLTAQVLPHLQPLTDGLQQASAEPSHHHHHRHRPHCVLLVFAGEGWIGQTGTATSLDTDVGGNHLNMYKTYSLTSAGKMNHFLMK